MSPEQIHSALRRIGHGLINHPEVRELAEALAKLMEAPKSEPKSEPKLAPRKAK